MTAGELLEQYRLDMVDTVTPHFWSDTEAYRYMASAYNMFVRLTGGIADFTSKATQVDIVVGENVAALDKSILRIMEASRGSDTAKIEVINQANLTFQRDNDYGRIRQLYTDNTPGPVRYMIIGAERNKVRWVQMPEVADVANLLIYRLPLNTIDPLDPDESFDFSEVEEEHHTHFVLWMRYLGYMKADADTFDQGKATLFKAQFEEYCNFTKAEWERYKHKNRSVAYGGL